uniref:DUF569 domain-containing protein n=1 Tax=Oryza glumipatula TaxID=40148 RepID=A0A0E0AGB1_9ORYZ
MPAVSRNVTNFSPHPDPTRHATPPHAEKPSPPRARRLAYQVLDQSSAPPPAEPRHATPRSEKPKSSYSTPGARSLAPACVASPPRRDAAPRHRADTSLALSLQPLPRMMEAFQGVDFAALRVWQCDSYLHADEDGRSVYHRRLGGCGGGVATTLCGPFDELVVGEPPTRYVLLRGAYGRYLGTLDPGDRERGASWRSAPSCGGPPAALASSGRYLRGNKNFLARRRSVSVDDNVDKETTCCGGRWCPSTGWSYRSWPMYCNLTSSCSLYREIRFVTAEDAAAADAGQFAGRSVQLLREKLAGIVGYDEFMLCVRTGLHGRLTPLLINLPRSQETLHIVLIRTNTTGNNQTNLICMLLLNTLNIVSKCPA